MRIEYENKIYNINNSESEAEWKQKLSTLSKIFGVDESEREAAIEWLNFHTLIGEGIFVSRPSMPEPNLAAILNKTENEPEVTYTHIDAEYKKLLTEKAKFLKEKEQWLSKKEIGLAKAQSVIRTQGRIQQETVISHAYFTTGLVLFCLFLIALVIMLFALAWH